MLKVLKFPRMHALNGSYPELPSDYDEEAADIEYQLCKDNLLDTFREILALDSDEKQNRAMDTWFLSLKETCTAKDLCSHCYCLRRH